MKPFPENGSDVQKMEWLKQTPPWNEIDEKILNAILKKYNGDPMIVVFVLTSMKLNLVPLYRDIINSIDDDSEEIILPLIALKLYQAGSHSLKKCINLYANIASNKNEFKDCYANVMDTFESCLILDENQASAYLGLATINKLIHKDNDAKDYAKKGIEVSKRLQKKKKFIQLSKNEHFSNAPEIMKEVEKGLNQILES